MCSRVGMRCAPYEEDRWIADGMAPEYIHCQYLAGAKICLGAAFYAGVMRLNHGAFRKGRQAMAVVRRDPTWMDLHAITCETLDVPHTKISPHR
eukprot:scaffold109308_cov33-Tisochrysis_lutea.AAC.1